MNKNIISVIDGEAGSCGKAKVVGEIATDKTINLGLINSFKVDEEYSERILKKELIKR